MAVQEKFADEMLTDDELDRVAGGTKQELQELYSAMAVDRVLKKYLKTSTRDNINLDEIALALREKFDIEFSYGTLDRKNEYIHNGQKIDHHELVEFCKRYDYITNYMRAKKRLGSTKTLRRLSEGFLFVAQDNCNLHRIFCLINKFAHGRRFFL